MLSSWLANHQVGKQFAAQTDTSAKLKSNLRKSYNYLTVSTLLTFSAFFYFDGIGDLGDSSNIGLLLAFFIVALVCLQGRIHSSAANSAMTIGLSLSVGVYLGHALYVPSLWDGPVGSLTIVSFSQAVSVLFCVVLGTAFFNANNAIASVLAVFLGLLSALGVYFSSNLFDVNFDEAGTSIHTAFVVLLTVALVQLDQNYWIKEFGEHNLDSIGVERATAARVVGLLLIFIFLSLVNFMLSLFFFKL